MLLSHLPEILVTLFSSDSRDSHSRRHKDKNINSIDVSASRP